MTVGIDDNKSKLIKETYEKTCKMFEYVLNNKKELLHDGNLLSNIREHAKNIKEMSKMNENKTFEEAVIDLLSKILGELKVLNSSSEYVPSEEALNVMCTAKRIK